MSKGIDEKKVLKGGTWASSLHGDVYFAAERPHFDAGVRQIIGPSTLQVGSMLDQSVIDDLELPFLLKAQLGPTPSAHSRSEADLAADPAFLPFEPETFNTVLLPHVLEAHFLPHQVLREAHRVLAGEGCVLITGFNPSSFLGLQRWLRPRAALPGRYYTPGRVIDWLNVLGFEVVASSMFQYSPISSKPKVTKMFGFLESVGDRWLPMFGGGYMIAAKKKVFNGNVIGRTKLARRQRQVAVTASAKSSSKSAINSSTKRP